MRGVWALRLRAGAARAIPCSALWCNSLQLRGLLRCVGPAGQPTGHTPLSRCGDFGLGDFGSGSRGRFRASLFGAMGCRCLSCFDWFTKLVNLQALRPSRDAGTLDLTAFDWGGEGNDRLRSLAQWIAVAWVTSRCRPGGPTYRLYVSCAHAGSPNRLSSRVSSKNGD